MNDVGRSVAARLRCRAVVVAWSALAVIPLGALDVERDIAVTGAGGIRIVHPDFPASALNPWPAAEEEAFWRRVNHFLPEWRDAAANPSQKLEGQGHDTAMLAWLAGDRQRAQAWFVEEDLHRTDHAHTEGIDFYWGFTLKYRPAWWFLFNHTFPADYRERVWRGMTTWSAEDPRPCLEYTLMLENPVPQVRDEARRYCELLWRDRQAVEAMAAAAAAEDHPNRRAFATYLRAILPAWPATMPDTPAQWRDWYALIAGGDWKVYEEYERLVNPRPHPLYHVGTGPVGTEWTPQVRGGWADARNTDNLRAMREIAAYLFAEATGNETTRLVMKEKLRRTLVDYYTVGMGEWDSPTYHPATINTWVGLHDHARDPEVRLIGKGVLDYLWTIAALKFRGNAWGGPACRDYGTPAPGGDAAVSAWIFYGSLATPPARPTKSWVNQIISPYRPPQAVLALARRQFPKPCEILTSHPAYQTWLPGKTVAPETHATLFYGDTYQIGTRVRGSHYNINGIRTLMDNGSGDATVLSTTGGTGNISRANAGGDRIAHYRNLVLYLNGTDPAARFRFATDHAVPHEIDGGVLFLRNHRTWVAIRPINIAIDSEPSTDVADLGLKKRRWRHLEPMVLHAQGTRDGAVRGFAMEFGEATATSYAAFKAAVLAQGSIAVGDGERPRVTCTGSTGATVAMRLGEDLPAVWRDGELHDWSAHHDLYRPTTGSGPVSLGWKQGTLCVTAGGHVFTGSVDPVTGTYSFTNATHE